MHNVQSRVNVEPKEADVESIAHDRLSRTCIRYFSSREIMRVQPTLRGMGSEFPLLRYAVAHWIAHVQQGEKNVARTDLLRYFGWPSEQIVELLANFHASARNTPPWRRRNHTTLLHIA